MFLTHEVTIESGFEAASVRLVHLINRDALRAASEDAYEGGLAAELRVGPFGSMRGLSKLVRVRLLEPARRGVTVTIPLRWEATGAAGELFPVLDADLILTGDGAGRARLALAGTYRPPFGRAGAALDRALMRRIATATIRALLANVVDAIVHSAPQFQARTDTVSHGSRSATPAHPEEWRNWPRHRAAAGRRTSSSAT